MFDKMTSEVAKEWITKFEAAQERGDMPAMNAVVDTVCASPNRPFKLEVLRQLGFE